MFKHKPLNLCGVWRGLAGAVNLCPNCYQRAEVTARGSMQIQQKNNKMFDVLRKVICFPVDTFPEWYKWVRSYMSVQNARLLSSSSGGGAGRRVIFKPPLSIVGSVAACFGNIPCKLCIQGFTVHVHAVHVHTKTNSYLCPRPVPGIYVKIKWNEIRK